MQTAYLPTSDEIQQIERLIRLSKERPLLPEQFIPWQDKPTESTLFMPEHLVSLHGHSLWETLSDAQKRELGRLEMVQVMYSYAWSEGLATLFFNRVILKLMPDNVVYRFLVRECLEEFRHQDMFANTIKAIDGNPLRPNGLHRFLGSVTARFFPDVAVFLSVLAVEMIADAYGKEVRRDEKVFSIMRKSSELHHIEEGRHIHFTRILLRNMTQNAGWLKRSAFSLIVMLNVWFMRTLYVRREFFVQIGVSDPDFYYKEARRNFKKNYAQHCLDESIEFTKKDLNGFNWLTRPLWRWSLSAAV